MPWMIDEVSQEAFEYFKNNDKVEIVLRDFKKRYQPFLKTKLKWIEDVKDDVFKPEDIRKVLRNQNKNTVKLDQIADNLNQVFKPLENLQILSILNTAISAANIAASVAGMLIISDKLNYMDQKLNELQKEIADVKKALFETQINKPCRELMDDYRMIANNLGKGKPVSEDKLITLIRNCKENILSVYNLRESLPLDVALNLMFTLMPVLANCMMVYYQRFYDPEQEKHTLHESCMAVFDQLSAPVFIDQIQDYMFMEKFMTNKQVNEYLDCHRLLVYSYKKQIEQLLEDLKTCGSSDAYADVMQWSHQYAEQQKKVVQTELENRYGVEKAMAIMSQEEQE